VGDTKAEVCIHLVWATAGRQDLITPEIERAVHRCLAAQAAGLGCEVLALGGTTNHVHLLVKLPTQVPVAALAHQVKGASSHLVRSELEGQRAFRWQVGYGAFSVSQSDVPAVKAYIRDQKSHHQAGEAQERWGPRHRGPG
jgi:REP element-mobilizing transposase RayT